MDKAKNKDMDKAKKEFTKMIKTLSADKKAVAEKLIKEIVFMSETLDMLRAQIEKNGPLEDFKQGKQEFTRESPALRSYNTTIQRYSTLYKQLTDLIGKTVPDAKKDTLTEFLKNG